MTPTIRNVVTPADLSSRDDAYLEQRRRVHGEPRRPSCSLGRMAKDTDESTALLESVVAHIQTLGRRQRQAFLRDLAEVTKTERRR